MIDVEKLLRTVIERGASDLHLKAGRPPLLRINGQLTEQSGWPVLDPPALQQVLDALTSQEQRATLSRDLELDLAYELPHVARFRVNVGCQRRSLYLTLRHIRGQVPTLADLGLPDVCVRLAKLSRGLVLVTGPTGSGKSTTLAAMIEHINSTLSRRVVTVEDPIEYLFEDKQCVITQREVGSDARSFASALKYALRQDPDVIMVGEMRDLETIAATLTAAETGHLVLATLHTPSAPEAIDRIVDVFPPHQQAQVRVQLAMTLAGVLSQRLVLRADGSGRVAACEVMTGTPAVRNLIREAKTPQMVNIIQTGREHGMQTLEQALRDLYRSQTITLEEALTHAGDPEGLKRLLGG
jgi:twitching motility protein PilT